MTNRPTTGFDCDEAERLAAAHVKSSDALLLAAVAEIRELRERLKLAGAVIEAANQLRENWTGKSNLFAALEALEDKINEVIP